MRDILVCGVFHLGLLEGFVVKKLYLQKWLQEWFQHGSNKLISAFFQEANTRILILLHLK